jgi:hypothetical protein
LFGRFYENPFVLTILGGKKKIFADNGIYSMMRATTSQSCDSVIAARLGKILDLADKIRGGKIPERCEVGVRFSRKGSWTKRTLAYVTHLKRIL